MGLAQAEQGVDGQQSFDQGGAGRAHYNRLGLASYTQRAQALREECLSLPGAEEAAGWLEELAGLVSAGL